MKSSPVRRPWWALALLALGGLWMLFFGCIFVTGYWATVTVTGGQGDGFCDVVWEDPSGQRHRGESDCYDEPVGSRFEVRVSGWPDAGEPTLAETYAGIGLTVGLPPVALGAGRLLHLAWRRTRAAMPQTATPTAPEGSGGALTGERTAAAFSRVRRRALALVGLGLLGASSVALLAVLEDAADRDLRAVGVTTVGTVMGVHPDTKWDTGAAAVRFTANGVTGTRDVRLGGYAGDYVEGDVVDVVYDPRDPARFIVDDALYGPAWVEWALVPSLFLASLTPFGIVRVVRFREMRRLLASRIWAPVRMDVVDAQHCWEFITADGSFWRSWRYLAWLPDWAPHDSAGHGLPDDQESAWWVSDGTTAVFAHDPGGTLVLARRR